MTDNRIREIAAKEVEAYRPQNMGDPWHLDWNMRGSIERAIRTALAEQERAFDEAGTIVAGLSDKIKPKLDVIRAEVWREVAEYLGPSGEHAGTIGQFRNYCLIKARELETGSDQ